MNTQNTAPTFEQLLDWLEGRLSAKEAGHMTAWVSAAGDPTQADEAWLRTFFEVTQNMRSADPSAELVERLEQRFAAFSQRPTPSLWQRLVAGLTFDSHKSVVARGARAGGPGDQRQFLYETEHATVVFTLQRRERGELFDLLGQVMPTDESEVDLIRISLLREDVEFDSTITDDLGEFILPAIPRGQYNMVLVSNFHEITIPSIDLFT